MRLQAYVGGVVILLAGGLGCKDKAKGHSEPPTRVTTSVSDAGAVRSDALVVPHGVPLTGEALAAHYRECIGRINEGKLAELPEHCFDADVVIHEVDHDDYKGVTEVNGYYEKLRAAIKDFALSPQLILVSGRDILAIERLSGTHTGELELPEGGTAAGSGKKFGVLRFQHLMTDQNNKVIEAWEFLDHHSLQDQLGVGHASGGQSRAVVANDWPGAPKILVGKVDDSETANLALVDKITAAFNARKPGDVAALWADNALVSDQADHEDHRGKNAFEQSIHGWSTSFPDAKLNVTHSFSAGEYIVVEGRLTGTHKSKYAGVAATNRSVDIAYADVFKVDAGKVTELWRFRDGMALVAQLTAKPGAKPSGRGSASK